MTPTLLNNRYRVLQPLGAGGFGNTFLAEDSYMPSGRKCVIKQLKPVTNDPKTYKMIQDRFQREAAVLEDLGEGSNQIPNLFAYFSEGGQFYLVQEYIEGETLTKKVEKGGVQSESEVKRILVSLLPVLDYIHNRHIVHRDIKPDNIIVRKRDNLPVLIDFGAVKEAMNTVVNDPNNSAPSMVIGTPGFMPSEQAGGRPTFASDLYSLGLTAVFLLTGKMPQELETDSRTGEFIWRRHAPNVNSNLAMVLDRAIRLHPRDRFANAKEMLDALQVSNNAAPSEMATVAVSPGALPHPENQQTRPIANPTPGQTIPVGEPGATTTENWRKPWLIGAGIVGTVLVAGLAIGSLRRAPEPSTTASSSSDSVSKQSSNSTATNSRTQTTDPVTRNEETPIRQEVPTSTSSRTESTNSDPISKPSNTASNSRTQSSNRSLPSETIPVPSPETANNQKSRSIPVPPPETASNQKSRSIPVPPPETASNQKSRSIPVPPPETANNNSRSNTVPSSKTASNNQGSNISKNIPAFAPGTQRSYVLEELGKPTKESSGYWNTRAFLYENVVPNQVDLGYLFDRSSGRLRQTEATFSQSVDVNTMSGTLDKLLNGNASADIKQGLQDVYLGKAPRHRFVSGRDGSLKGVIERDKEDRIYIGVWEADLH
jgi:serine/threonine-protein kinase